MSTITYRFLSPQDLPSILDTFVAAFEDYYVQVSFTPESFAAFLATNGVDFGLSVGAFDGTTMVGILLNAVDQWHYKLTAYDSGTGVIPEYRGRKIAGAMLEYAIPALQAQGISHYLLEVIQANEPAARVYRQLGFTETRLLDCFQGRQNSIKQRPTDLPNLMIQGITQPDWDHLQTFWDWCPAWQNTIETVRRTQSQTRLLGAFWQNTCIGYIIFYPERGRIAQFAVSPEHRKRGVGSHLLQACAQQTRRHQPLSIINVDSVAGATLAFLHYHGFIKTLSQYEMVLGL